MISLYLYPKHTNVYKTVTQISSKSKWFVRSPEIWLWQSWLYIVTWVDCINIYEVLYGSGGMTFSLKDLWNANACWLVLIYNTLIITDVAKRLFKYVPYIFFFSSEYLDTPTKNLHNQDSWGDITCQSPSSKHYHFKRQGYVWTVSAKCSLTMAWYNTLQKKGNKGVFVECYCDKALSTNYLA